MFAFAGYTFLRLFKKRFYRLAALPVILIPLIYYVGFQGYARYVIPFDALSDPAGLANFLSSILAAWFGASVLSKDKELGYVELMMTKPLAPWKFIAGKCLGSLAAMGVIWAIVCFSLVTVGTIGGQPLTIDYAFVLIFAFIGQALIFLLAFLLSLGIPPLMAGILALILNDRVFHSLVINIDGFEGLGSLKAPAHWVINILYYAVPQVSEFALWGTAGYVYIIDPVRVLVAICYAGVYGLLILAAAVFFFERSNWNQQ